MVRPHWNVDAELLDLFFKLQPEAVCLYQISPSHWQKKKKACHKPLRSLPSNKSFKFWMPRVCIPFSYNEVFNSNLLFTMYFLKLCFFAIPLFQLIACPTEFCLCYLLWMYYFLTISTLISVVSHFEPYLLIGLDNGSQVYLP